MQQQALLLNAAAEIGTGFMTVAALLAPPRNLLLPFMVWQILKMRFWSPDAANYHRQVRACGASQQHTGCSRTCIACTVWCMSQARACLQ